jgi:DNA-directed RNA polymerase III subunit RPC3
MIQHNILWHVENPNEGEMLEIGWEEVLVRLRFGRYIELAREVVGVEVGTTCTDGREYADL